MSEWKIYKAEEFCLTVTDGTHDSPKPQPCGRYLITSKHLKPYEIDFSSANKIEEEDYNKIIQRSKVEQYDILFSMIGTIGTIYRVKFPEVDFAVKNMGIFKMGGNPEKSLWMYYWLQSSEAKEYINSRITGSTQGYLTLKSLRDFPVRVPPLETQKRIADILSAIDDKIELNRRINANLEQQAQALYKSWFVDFEFPNEEGKPYKSSGGAMQESELGLIPNYWHVGKLSDIADITMGQSPVGTSYNDCGNGVVFYQGRTEFGFRFPSIKLFTTAPTRYAEPMSVLLSVRAPVGDINIAAQKCCIGRGLASIKSKNNHNSFMYYCLNALKIQLEQYNGEGTVFGSINKKELENLKMSIPNDLIVANFNRIINRIDTQILNLSNEINNLSTLRDTLLPKLMSGEINVSTN